MTFEVSLVGIKLYEGEWKQHSHKNREFINTKINSLIVFFAPKEKEEKVSKSQRQFEINLRQKRILDLFCSISFQHGKLPCSLKRFFWDSMHGNKFEHNKSLLEKKTHPISGGHTSRRKVYCCYKIHSPLAKFPPWTFSLFTSLLEN